MRKFKPSALRNYNSAGITTIRLSPVCYYQEEEMFIDEIELKLEDATKDEFLALYKNYQHNYFQHNTKLRFYTDLRSLSNMFFLFNDAFFNKFKENRFYCKASSFNNLSDYLVSQYYTSENEYHKTVLYLKSFFEDNYKEGSGLVSFKFKINK